MPLNTTIPGHEYRVQVPSELTNSQAREINKQHRESIANSRIGQFDFELERVGNSINGALNKQDTSQFNVSLTKRSKNTLYATAELLQKGVYLREKMLKESVPKMYMATTPQEVAQLKASYMEELTGFNKLTSGLGTPFMLKGSNIKGLVAFVDRPLGNQYSSVSAKLDEETLGGLTFPVSQDLNVAFQLPISQEILNRIGFSGVIDSGCTCSAVSDDKATSRHTLHFTRGGNHQPSGSILGGNTDTDYQVNNGFTVYVDKIEADPNDPTKNLVTMTPAITRNTKDAFGNFLAGMTYDLRVGDIISAGVTDVFDYCNIKPNCFAEIMRTPIETICYEPNEITTCIWEGPCLTDEDYWDHRVGELSLDADATRQNALMLNRSALIVMNELTYFGQKRTDAGTQYNITPNGTQITMPTNMVVPNGTNGALGLIVTHTNNVMDLIVDSKELDYQTAYSSNNLRDTLELLSLQANLPTLDTANSIVVGAVDKAMLIGGALSDMTSLTTGLTHSNNLAESQRIVDARTNNMRPSGSKLFETLFGSSNMLMKQDSFLDLHLQPDTLFLFNPKEIIPLSRDFSSILQKTDFMTKGLLNNTIKVGDGSGKFDVAGLNKDASIMNFRISSNIVRKNDFEFNFQNTSFVERLGTAGNKPVKLHATMDLGLAITGKGISNSAIVRMYQKSYSKPVTAAKILQPTVYLSRLGGGMDGNFNRSINFINNRNALSVQSIQ